MFRAWCELQEWKYLKGCHMKFPSQKKISDGNYRFCNGHRSCQLIKNAVVCDGHLDCFDRNFFTFNRSYHIIIKTKVVNNFQI